MRRSQRGRGGRGGPAARRPGERGAGAGEPVVVTASRVEERAFDAPASIAILDAATLRVAGPQVNLSEALVRVPGITVLNRQNYAQDLQLSIRGFGSRSTFGIRGVRLIVDGIPATMPDGQGQASNVSLSSAARIEVLRGPLAQLYGNAAGGVVQVFTEAGAAAADAHVGRRGDALRRASLRARSSPPPRERTRTRSTPRASPPTATASTARPSARSSTRSGAGNGMRTRASTPW